LTAPPYWRVYHT